MAAESYLRSDGDTLKNLVGATTRAELAEAEAHFVADRQRRWPSHCPVPRTFDAAYLRAIHKYLFQDIFEWAGRTRNERVRLSDGTVADMPVMMRRGSKPFTQGPDIQRELTVLFRGLKAAHFLRDLDCETFADRAADCFARLNDIHPFREGNGRTMRTFFEHLAADAGHDLDFSVVSNLRNSTVAIRAHNFRDLKPMHRLFREIVSPERVAALRTAQAALTADAVAWRDIYVSTTEPGRSYRGVELLSITADCFVARAGTSIVVGSRSELPSPEPVRGAMFNLQRRKSKSRQQRSDEPCHEP